MAVYQRKYMRKCKEEIYMLFTCLINKQYHIADPEIGRFDVDETSGDE